MFAKARIFSLIFYPLLILKTLLNGFYIGLTFKDSIIFPYINKITKVLSVIYN